MIPFQLACALVLAQAKTPEANARVAAWGLWIWFAATFVAIFGGLFVLSLMRRRRRLQALQERAETPERKLPDAWAEAGRRAETPSASELQEAEAGGPARRTVPEPATRAVKEGAGRPLAMVTGAARRVGRAITLELARAGCDIIFTYNASADDAERLARELSDLGATVSFYQVDFAEPGAVEAFAAGLADTLPRLDVLVHNASVYEPSPLSDMGSESALNQYRVNALSPLMLTARLAPLLQSSILKGGGAVVAMSDIQAMGRPRRDFAAYAMSKAALTEMVHCLARDLAPAIRVNGVAPGVVAWPESGEESDPLVQTRYLKRIPLGRAGEPDDAAKAVRWLALEATYMTGEIVRVDGGRWLT